MNDPELKGGDGPAFQRMTVANIREREGADFIEVVFLESARFYRLPKKSKDFAGSFQLLTEALASHATLAVGLVEPNSDEITSVKP